MNFKIGKLYEVKQYNWLVYPDKETMVSTTWRTTSPWRHGYGTAEYWSNRLNCRVSFIPEKSFFDVLSQEEEFAHILSPDALGWIYVPNQQWANDCFEELTEKSCK